MPSGRFRPSGFGMYTRRTGCGRYSPALSSSWIAVRKSTTPRCPIVDRLSPSTPPAPRLLCTRFHASSSTSRRKIRSYSAWKRRPRFSLAALKRRRWRCRTLSSGVLGALAAMPLHVPPQLVTVKAGLLPSARVVVSRFIGTVGPSDSLPAPTRFALGLSGAALPDVGGRVGSLLFRARLSSRALLRTPGASCATPDLAHAVCCLRRDMTGSATPPFRVSISRGCKVHASRVGPAMLLPSQDPYGSLRALDAPLGRRDLSRRLVPATRLSGDYRGGTRTR